MLHVLVNYINFKLDLLNVFSTKNTDRLVRTWTQCVMSSKGYGSMSVCVFMWVRSGICTYMSNVSTCTDAHGYVYVCVRVCMSTCLALQIQSLCIYSTCVHVCMTLPVPVHVGVYWVSRCTRGWWRSPGRTGRGVW